MKTPNINLEELRAQKDENFRDRLKFIDQYADWLKKTPEQKLEQTAKNPHRPTESLIAFPEPTID
ncbi:MAG: hypothetical protein V1875_06815 [Candidatus Altiarchaeota archaeon]